ncbi:sensor domain-containing protein [Deinococcus radiotolerans]|uniref:Diguanylate cyclase/phosphodiesterase with PAS/PAC and GAF sensor(S) n=1 Tax=Deinococcus radiotolerans TaxID=1309407 RepID=A0ABQ2FKL6_9DEIO|nr:EAL domain-containing protein [Deinococcus radiotolerans]GGL00565.1 hypothetical protein GCM10010844_18780 [Deinococcus radiotolerans]
MNPAPDVQAEPEAPGAALAVLILDDRTHAVLGCTDAMSTLLGLTLTPGEALPPGLMAASPGRALAPNVVLHSPAGPVPCQAQPLGGLAHATLLCPLHQLSHTVLDAMPTDVAVLNASGRYLYVNPAAIRDAAVRRGIIGRTDLEYMQWRAHPTERAATRARHFQEAARSGQSVQFVETFSGARTSYLRRTYQPLLDEAGNLQLMLGYGEDQTRDRTQEDQRRLLRTMVDTSRDPLLVIDARSGPGHQRVEYANPAMLDLLRHHGLEALPDTPLPEWPMARGNSVNVLQMLGQLEGLPRTEALRDTLFLPEAQQWLEVHINAILDADGQRSHWAVNLRDITAQRTADIWRERTAQAHRLALAGAPLSASLTPLLAHADNWEIGWQIGAVIASHPTEFEGHLPPEVQQALRAIPPDELTAHWHALDPAQQGRAAVTYDLDAPGSPALHRQVRPHARSLIELPLFGLDGQVLGALLATHPVPHAWTASVVENLSAVATSGAILIEQHLNKVRLERLAYRDPLTGLLNRSALTDWTAAALRQETPLALGLMDLNRFRFLNDGFGHAVGDQLLADLARRLCHLAEQRGLLALARMGGDEFGLLTRAEDQQAVVRDLQALFEEPFEVRGSALLLEASVGWSLAPDTARDAHTLLQQADAALYEAKRAQVFSQVFQPAPPARIPTVTLESALRASLRDGGFRMVYQPQVQLGTGVLIGAEALLRWTHPELGVIPPDQFIPAAERAGLMPRLGEWVLTTALREAARWTNPNLSVSVNVSSRQLADPTFSDRVAQALSGSGLRPDRVVLEVTESGLIDNPARAREVLQGLRAQGVRVSMDDFGTGYSSLFSLRSLPVDELKIDRAFVRDLGLDTQAARESQAIVTASVLMARSLRMELLAEGVETQVQAQVLQEAGCELAQGWLYARPMEPDAFDAFEVSWPERLLAPRSAPSARTC